MLLFTQQPVWEGEKGRIRNRWKSTTHGRWAKTNNWKVQARRQASQRAAFAAKQTLPTRYGNNATAIAYAHRSGAGAARSGNARPETPETTTAVFPSGVPDNAPSGTTCAAPPPTYCGRWQIARSKSKSGCASCGKGIAIVSMQEFSRAENNCYGRKHGKEMKIVVWDIK